MRRARRASLLVVACLSCGTTAEPPPEREIGGERMPPPVEVCIVESSGAHVRATLTPHWAGMYSPDLPVIPEDLNWRDPGGHCMSPPVGSITRVPCPDGEAIPLVTPVLCQR